MASSYKHAHVKARIQKPYPIYDLKSANINTLFMTKTAENHSLWGTYLYSPYKRVTPGDSVKKKMKLRNHFTTLLCISQWKPRFPGYSRKFNIYRVMIRMMMMMMMVKKPVLKPRIVGASEHRNQIKKQLKSASFVSDTL